MPIIISLSLTSVPPTTLLELPFTPQSGKFSSKVLGANVVVEVFSVVVVEAVVAEMSPEAAGMTSAEASEELDDPEETVVVVVDSGNIDGQMAAPMAPIAMPTGKAIPSSCLVSLLIVCVMSGEVVEVSG